MKYDQSPGRRNFPSLLVLLSLLLIAGLSCDRIGAKGQIKDRLAAIQKTREPVTLEELDKWYEEPGPDENAAPILEESFSSLVFENADTARLPVVGQAQLPPLAAPLPEAMKRDVAGFLSKNQKALDFLHKAAALKKCRFPTNLKKGPETVVSHLAEVRSSSRLLELEAIFNAETGKTDEVVRSVVTSLRLARFLEGEPLLISQLVRLACQNLSCSIVERILNRASLSDDQLSTLLAAFQEEENSLGITRSLVGERCEGIWLFQLPAKERETRVAQMVSVSADKSIEQSSWHADFAFFLQAMEEAIAASKLPFPKKLDARDRLILRSAEAKKRGYLYSRAVLPTLAKVIPKEARPLAQLRCAVAALAVQRYRLAHENNNLPASLQETVPALLKAIPVDPYHGNPLQYRRESAIHFVVSSVGEDDRSREVTFEVKR